MKRNKGIEDYRYFLKDSIRSEINFSNTDQSKGIKPPPVEKLFKPEDERIKLREPGKWQDIENKGTIGAIKKRRSRRKYSDKALTLDELSFLLWATQGIRKSFGSITFRNVPSAGNRHSFETYICALNAEGLQPGIYRYLAIENELLIVAEKDQDILSKEISLAALGQFFLGKASAVFIWAAIPYRTEWRYGKASHKVIAIDAGHVCQNLYIACEVIEAGTCAVAAYDQKLMDNLVKVDGKDEFVVYLAPVGKLKD